MPTYQDKCECGNAKDKRSRTCRTCFETAGSERMTKVCTTCKEDKPMAAFRFRKRVGEDKPRSSCRDCEAKEAQQYRKDNPEKAYAAKKDWEKRNPDSVDRITFRSRAKALGLDPNEIEKLYEAHDGMCDICTRRPIGHWKTLAIDHCHTTGKFRGFLCGECNLGLGKFKDSPELLAAAIRYLETHSVLDLPIKAD